MSTKKHKETTFKIEDIEAEKNGSVKITVNGKEYSLSSDSYLDAYYYRDKEMSEEEFDHLKESSKEKKYIDYIKYLISYKPYTKREIRDKVEKKFKLPDEKIEELLYKYVEDGIIDDTSYAVDFIENKKSDGYGNRYIIVKLKERGIDDVTISSSEVIDALSEEVDIDEVVKRLAPKYRNLIAVQREKKLTEALITRGFDYSSASSASKRYMSSMSSEELALDEEKKARIISEEISKCYNRYKDLPEDKIVSKIYLKLRGKGFSCEDIKSKLRKDIDND